ncbi:hypothetical protein BH09PLA1_BH09PLA1_23560 [soil metagenome]
MSERLAKKVLLIGWDSADWKLIQPLMDAGHMPALASLVENGVMGNLSTLKPVLSPILWNSIATGKRADKHGILGFVEPNPEGTGVRTVASTSRKCKAIWNILTQRRMKTNVIGWYASHPAEPIDGVCVTEHFAHYDKQLRDPSTPPPPQSLHPAALADSLVDLRVRPWDIGPEHLSPIMPKIGEIPDEKAGPIGGARKMLARCATIHAIATELIEHQPWDLTAIYYETLDHFGHGFMSFHPPKMDHVSAQEFEWYKDVMNGVYMFHDLMLGRLLHLAGPDTTVMLVSDHGFYSDHLRPAEIPGGPPVGPEAWHRHHGVFVMKGPNIQKDERIYGASILDITPTILTLLGLPIGQDMDGKVLAQCFEKPVEIARIASWETEPPLEGAGTGMHPPDMQGDPFEQQQAMQQLIELGYLAAPTTDASKLIDLATKETRYNLAMVHYGAAQYEKAAPVLEKLVADYPDESRFALSLAQCHLIMKRFPEARRLIESVKTEGLAAAQHDLMLGTLEFAEGNRDEALKFLLRAEQAEPRLPLLHTQIGNVNLQQRRWADAQRAFEKALSIDGDSAPAHYGLGIVAFHQDRFEDAADLLLRAVGLQHYFPRAHFALGMSLARLNWYDRAVHSLNVTLSQAPHFISAHRFLAVCYGKLGNPDQAMVHRQLAQKILEAQTRSRRAP